jgi:shikimate dehydrogenase
MKRAFVVGYPIAHSRSPLIHNFWLAQSGLDGHYERVAVAPGSFAGFLETLAEQGYAGGNVTVPRTRRWRSSWPGWMIPWPRP